MDLFRLIWAVDGIDASFFPMLRPEEMVRADFCQEPAELKGRDHHLEAALRDDDPEGDGSCRRGFALLSAKDARDFDLNLRGMAARAVVKSLTLNQLDAVVG